MEHFNVHLATKNDTSPLCAEQNACSTRACRSMHDVCTFVNSFNMYHLNGSKNGNRNGRWWRNSCPWFVLGWGCIEKPQLRRFYLKGMSSMQVICVIWMGWQKFDFCSFRLWGGKKPYCTFPSTNWRNVWI